MSATVAAEDALGPADGGSAHADTAADLAAYREIVAALDEGVALLHVAHTRHRRVYRFVEANAAFERALGLAPGVFGLALDEALPNLDAHWVGVLDRVVAGGGEEHVVAAYVLDGLHRRVDVEVFGVGGASRKWIGLRVQVASQRMRSIEALRSQLERFATIVGHAPVGVALLDAEFRLLHANPLAQALLDEVAGRPEYQIGGPTGAAPTRTTLPAHVLAELRRTLVTGAPYHAPELVLRAGDGTPQRALDVRVERVQLQDDTYGLVGYVADVSAQVAARRALAASEERYRTLFESMDEAFCIVKVLFDEHGRSVDYRFVEVNPVFEHQTGIREAAGRTIRELVPDIEPFWLEMYADVARTGEPRRFVDRSAALGRWFDVFAFRVGDPGDDQVALLFSDVTVHKQAEEALRESVTLLRHHAHYDPLTGLPNRLMFEDRLHRALAEADEHGRAVALVFLDLDGFKEVNDEHGHACGDEVLRAAARRLRRAVRTSDALARIHGDEFVVLVADVSSADDAQGVARTLLAKIRAPIVIGDVRIRVGASIGVALYPRDARDALGLMKRADAAMYEAKRAGKNTVRLSNPTAPDGDPMAEDRERSERRQGAS